MMTKRKILIISDDSRLMGFLSSNLSGREYNLANTDNMGEDMEAALDRELPDLVILDILMPWMDGIELCLRVRQWCPAPIIMLSTWGARKDTVRGLDLGAESYLTEPFDIDGLRERIEGALYRN